MEGFDEYERVWRQIGSRSIEDLVDLPPMTNPERRATRAAVRNNASSALIKETWLWLRPPK
jgi:hypothetical protein